MEDLSISDYSYDLPLDRIAEFPLPHRDSSRLLVFNGEIKDSSFKHLPEFLPQTATLVLNNTKVIEARIFFTKPTGGVIEIFCLEPFAPSEMTQSLEHSSPVQWRCLIGGASKWKAGQVLQKDITIHGQTVSLEAWYISKQPEDFIIEFRWDTTHHFADVIHAAGNIPLPPYIKRQVEQKDSERYQTIFAKQEGSVAAPTAALHFTEEVFSALGQKNITPHYITLNVGAGTFKPMKAETISGHQMHGEHFTVTKETLKALLAAETLIAVGTTTLRTLESLYWLAIKYKEKNAADWNLSQWEAYDIQATLSYKQSIEILLEHLENNNLNELHCSTSILIRPGYQFKSADALITNFHQPRSTLILLVAAFVGEDWRKIYDHALANNYRFLSYGDSSLLWRKK